MIGVAPEAQIMNIKVLQRVPSEDPLPPGFADNTLNRCLFGGGSGLFSWTLEGMVDAVAHGADVISMSLGGFFPRTAQGQTRLWSSFNRVANFVNSHGAIVFAAAGNAGLDLGRIRSYVDLPAQASNIIAVMATTNPDCVENLNPNATCATGPDGLAFYSDFGSNLHGLSAPGGSLPAFGAPFPCAGHAARASLVPSMVCPRRDSALVASASSPPMEIPRPIAGMCRPSAPARRNPDRSWRGSSSQVG